MARQRDVRAGPRWNGAQDHHVVGGMEFHSRRKEEDHAATRVDFHSPASLRGSRFGAKVARQRDVRAEPDRGVQLRVFELRGAAG
jgi:hypothetical protein